MNIKVIVAAHKPYIMPNDDMYLPLHVGKKGKDEIGFIGDDSGDNISEKNPFFCEFTGIYWAYKNLEADYIGLVHYRRHFSLNPKGTDFSRVLSGQEAQKLFETTDVILPKQQNYYIESLYSHYSHTHSEQHLEVLEQVVSEKYPEYVPFVERLKKRTSAHMFNMFIMKKDIFKAYCDFVFDVLFEIEKRIDTSKMSSFDARLFGRIGELLLDIWLEKNQIKYKEIPYFYTEKIKLAKKVFSFLRAKFFGKKYKGSF